MVERRVFFICAIVAIIATGGLTKASSSVNTTPIPLPGGTYREGVVGASLHDLETAQTALTDVGLVTLTDSGDVTPALATKWTVSDDSQTIAVTLDRRLTAAEATDLYRHQTQSGYWNDAEVKAIDAQTLEFHLKKPWAGFLSELSAPIFPYGPFVMAKPAAGQADMVTFEPNPHALHQAYLTKVELHLFPDQKTLERAIRKGTVDGAYIAENTSLGAPRGWETIDRITSREYLVFFNLKNDRLADAATRQKIIKGERLDQPLPLRLVVADVPNLANLATDLLERLAKSNVQVTLDRQPLFSLNKTTIPNRDYDLLLVGIDYGADGDLYPYWDSLQIAPPGLNLDGYRNKDVDKLLDQARSEHDFGKRHALSDQVRTILTNDALYLSLGKQPVHLVRSQKMKGSVPQTLLVPNDRWKNIADWYEKAKFVKKTA